MTFSTDLYFKCYLSDGVYVGHDGSQFWLWAERDGREHSIALEPDTVTALYRYIDAFNKHINAGELNLEEI